jgi:hypothetical protein
MVWTNREKSGPKAIDSAQMVSRASFRSVLSGPSKTLSKGCRTALVLPASAMRGSSFLMASRALLRTAGGVTITPAAYTPGFQLVDGATLRGDHARGAERKREIQRGWKEGRERETYGEKDGGKKERRHRERQQHTFRNRGRNTMYSVFHLSLPAPGKTAKQGGYKCLMPGLERWKLPVQAPEYTYHAAGTTGSQAWTPPTSLSSASASS